MGKKGQLVAQGAGAVKNTDDLVDTRRLFTRQAKFVGVPNSVPYSDSMAILSEREGRWFADILNDYGSMYHGMGEEPVSVEITATDGKNMMGGARLKVLTEEKFEGKPVESIIHGLADADLRRYMQFFDEEQLERYIGVINQPQACIGDICEINSELRIIQEFNKQRTDASTGIQREIEKLVDKGLGNYITYFRAWKDSKIFGVNLVKGAIK
jgi:hypothetical protein